jgi:hypothetical protein
MAYKQGKNPFSKNPLNFNSPLNSFDSLVGKLMNQGKSKEAATKIAGKVANAKLKGAGSGPTAAQKARAKGSAAKMEESPLDKELVGNQHRLPEELKAKIEAAPESPAKMKSPVKAHDKALKALEKRIKRVRKSKEGSEGQGGIDYELLAQLEEQKKKLIESHGEKAKETAKPSPANNVKPAKLSSVSSISGEKITKVEGEKPELKTEPPKKKLTQADLDKGKSTAKSRGIVSSEGRDGSNRQERKKRRQERRSIRRNKDLSDSQKRMAIKESRKQQKDNVRGVKKESPAAMKSPIKKDGEKADLLSRTGKKVVKGINKARANVKSTINKKVRPKVKKAVKAVKEFSKDLQERGT